MKKIILFSFILLSSSIHAQKKNFYVGINLINSICKQVDSEGIPLKDAYAPGVGLLVEKKIVSKFSLQSGIFLIDRSSNQVMNHFSYFDPGDPDPYFGGKINSNLIYATLPLLGKINWSRFYLVTGADFNFPLYYYETVRASENITSKGSPKNKKVLLSLVLKAGYDWKRKNHVWFAEFIIDRDLTRLARKDKHVKYLQQMNIGIGLGYKFNLSKKQS